MGDCDPTEIPMEDDTLVEVVGVAHEDCESAPTLRALLFPLAADTDDATVAVRRAAAFTMHGDAIVYHNTVLQPGHTTYNLLNLHHMNLQLQSATAENSNEWFCLSHKDISISL